jgi:hypothetical protein
MLIKKWFDGLSKNQKWITYFGFALIVIFTLIHNPTSEYTTSFSNVCTRIPIGREPDRRYGYLNLGLLGTYFTFVAATLVLTFAAIRLAGTGKE